MKKFISILLGTILISLTACSTGSGTEKAKIEIIPEGTELSGTLNIWSDAIAHQHTDINSLKLGFEELHPDVTIIINDENSYVDSDGNTLDEKYMADLGIKMLSGNAPDLLYNRHDLVTNFVPAGLIYDLYEFIEADDRFNTEDYFEKILKLGEINGGLYSIAASALFEFYRLSEEVLTAAEVDPDTLENIDYKFIYDVYNKATASGKVPQLEYIGGGGAFHGFFEELSAHIDKDNLTASFNSPEFIDYLEMAKTYTGPDTRPIGHMVHPIYADYGFPETLPKDFPYIGVSVAADLLGGAQDMLAEVEGLTKPIPYLNLNGEYKILPGNSMSIPSNSKNPELAWEFIKYCVSETENYDASIRYWGKANGAKFWSGIPINKNNLEHYMSPLLAGYSSEQKEEFMSYIDTALNLPSAGATPPLELNIAIPLIVADYLNSMMTAEECAKAIQDRVEIYFAEIE